MENKKFITSYGLFCTLVATVVGIGVFSYPRQLADVIGTDAWLETFFIGALSLLIIRLIWKIESINNYMEFTSLIKRNFGGVFGGIVLMVFSGTMIFYVALSMRTFVEVIKMYLLEKTPTEFLLVITILCGIYLVRGGIGSVIKFNEVALWMMFIPVIFILLLALKLGDYTNVFPILHNKPINYIYSLKYTAFSFSGIEILFLIIPFLRNREKSKKIMDRGIIFITLFYALVTVMVLAILSKEHTKMLIWPTITMIKSLDVPGAFIERWDGIVMALWVLFYFTSFSNLYFFSSHIIKENFNLREMKTSSYVLAPFVYIIAILPKNIGEVFSIGATVIPIIFVFNLIVLPLLLYFTGKFIGKKEGA
jgi:spore germination protein (amino acid permease)